MLGGRDDGGNATQKPQSKPQAKSPQQPIMTEEEQADFDDDIETTFLSYLNKK